MFSIKPNMKQMSSRSDILCPTGIQYTTKVPSAKVRTSKVDQQGTGVYVLLAKGMGLRQMQTKGSDQLRDATCVSHGKKNVQITQEKINDIRMIDSS